jgi:hypothetical protein
MTLQKTGKLPNFIVIGSQKCGTTSLHYYLSLHPEISMSREKELNFFVEKLNWHKGVEWYKNNFVKEAKIYGEISPNYTYYPRFQGVPEKMHSLVPQAKLIYILRDPIQRIISEYLHTYSLGRENRSLDEAVKDLESSRYICRSQYYMQLEQYLPFFPKSSFYIMMAEDLSNRTEETLQKLFKFLGVDDSFCDRRFSEIKHITTNRRRKNAVGEWLAKTPVVEALEKLPFDLREKVKAMLFFPFSEKIKRPTIEPSLQAKLIEYLKPDTNRLREFTGLSFDDWCL